MQKMRKNNQRSRQIVFQSATHLVVKASATGEGGYLGINLLKEGLTGFAATHRLSPLTS